MSTNYFFRDTDLSAIFYPLSAGGVKQNTNTGFLYNDNGTYKDLIEIFASYSYGQTAPATGFTSTAYNNKDLNLIFQKKSLPPLSYTVSEAVNIKYTEISANGHVGLVFELENNGTSSGTAIFVANITYDEMQSESKRPLVVIVGGGGGGGVPGGGGGGGGGTTILDKIIYKDYRYKITVGRGGYGASLNSSAGGNGNHSIFEIPSGSGYDSYQSDGGRGGSLYLGGNGGDVSSIYGGGGGGGGNGSTAPPGSVGGVGGSASGGSYQGEDGKGPTYSPGYNSNANYIYGGSGGSSYHSNYNIPVLAPFRTVTNANGLLVGGGGAGGGSGAYVNPYNRGGSSGQGVGGSYGFTSSNGQNSFGYLEFGYGNGGGGGFIGSSSKGGQGGNGCVILYI